MHVCRDLEPVRRLLLKDEPATRSIYNVIFGRAGTKAAWVRVDDTSHPKVVLSRCRWLTLYATDRGAASRAIDGLPGRWNLSFSATPSWVYDHISRQRRMRWHNPCLGYALSNRSRLAEYRANEVGTLKPEDARLVARHWPYFSGRRDSSYIRWRIHAGPSAAIRRQGRPVAWALTHTDGSMGFLHVLEEWRGQGMARAIGTALARRVMKLGFLPFVFIERKNRASIRLTESMGFEPVGRFSWFAAEPKTGPSRPG